MANHTLLIVAVLALYLTSCAALVKRYPQYNLQSKESHLLKKDESFQPEQIHLSYGDNVFEMVITWSTFEPADSQVEYGIHGLTTIATGNRSLFIDGGSEKHSQYIHRVKLHDLKPNSEYAYHCGSELGWSAIYWFMTAPEKEYEWSPRLAIYGDMGNENAQSLARLQEEVQHNKYDAVFHVGDFAYDMDFDNGRVGDEFMRQIESIAAYVPYMTCPGNHEQLYNFSHYRARFSMPGESEGLWYSFNMGPVHFVSLSTEVYYNFNYGIKQLIKQFDWLKADLKEASNPENRALRPWIVTFGHRPMYCSNDDFDDCRQHETIIRKGLPFLHWFGLEELFFKYGVDLSIWAHEHSYERLWPVYDYHVYNGSKENPYKNPMAPVHITTGSAGCSERTDPFITTKPDWSAFRSSDYGYTKLQALNATHLHLEQVSDDKDGAVIDEVWIIKDSHGSYENKNKSSTHED